MVHGEGQMDLRVYKDAWHKSTSIIHSNPMLGFPRLSKGAHMKEKLTSTVTHRGEGKKCTHTDVIDLVDDIQRRAKKKHSHRCK